MREIKFRAWDKTKNKMHYNLWELHWRKDGLWALPEKFRCLNTDYKPLMQYTGLHDVNGKEIYEGDILRPIIINGTITDGVVIWGHGSFYVQQIGAEKLTDLLNDKINFEIIGNIHENPELLEGE